MKGLRRCQVIRVRGSQLWQLEVIKLCTNPLLDILFQVVPGNSNAVISGKGTAAGNGRRSADPPAVPQQPKPFLV